MAENLTEANYYDSLAHGKLCPIKQGMGADCLRKCDGPRCAWYDQTAGRCAVLSLAREK